MIWQVLGPVGLFQFCCGSAGGHWSAASDAAGEGGGVMDLVERYSWMLSGDHGDGL